MLHIGYQISQIHEKLFAHYRNLILVQKYSYTSWFNPDSEYSKPSNFYG